jgi:hypothetical protein
MIRDISEPSGAGERYCFRCNKEDPHGIPMEANVDPEKRAIPHLKNRKLISDIFG